MTVVITGASGFVGRNLSRALIKAGVEVVGLSRTDPNILGLPHIQADLTKPATLPTEFSSATVVHCAAHTHTGNSDLFRIINVEGTRNALQLNPDGKFIHISSSSVYNLSHASHDTHESTFSLTKYLFYNDYSQTKALAEEVLKETAAERTIAPISLRPHGVYGADDTTLLPRLLKRIRGQRIALPESGNVYHSLTNIDNLVQAIVQSMRYRFDQVEAFNISDSDDVLLRHALEAAAKHPLKVRNIKLNAALLTAKYTRFLSEYEIRQIGFERTYNQEKATTLINYSPTPFHISW